jgi:hypothetical protein
MNGNSSESKGIDSVGYYIELAKWFVGIGAAVLVFGFDKLSAHDIYGWRWGTFLASVLFLAGATVSGVIASMQLVGYANRRENGSAPGENETTVDGFRKWGTRAYRACGILLVMGVATFAAVWFANFLNPGGSETRNALVSPERASALLIEPSADRKTLRILIQTKRAGYFWVPLNASSLVPEFRSSLSGCSAARAQPKH